MELLYVGILLTAAHLAAIYYAIYVARMSYPNVLATLAVVGIAISMVIRLFEPAWKPRVIAALQTEERQGTAFADVTGMIGVILIGSMISASMIWSRYGWQGWAGAVGVQAVVNAVV